ncbi:hypothetical protein D9757_001529 [Collybiopsis confluens]|uniref:Peptidase S53 domain-containing protein n=1 Tax=Collybiopsis confluens TaxID=2823264 RepID=A0A8H5HZP7_9AGAR|nr:hypothetical protein D9757_001529 [Collybiopsis confluens]
MLITAVVSLAFTLPTIATPHFALFTDFVTKHSWGTTSLPPSTQWVYHSTPNPTSLLTLRLSLRSSNYDVLLEHLTQTSDPLHSRYGQHLTKEQADELMRPTDETVDEVKRWLRWNNIDDDAVHFSGNVVHLIVPVSYAEALLNTTYAWYFHVSDPDNKVVRTLAYSLPRHLHDHIDLVSPTTYFGNLRSMYRKRKELYRPRASALISPAPVPKSCADVITPACLQSLYNTKNFSSSITPRHAVGVTGYLEEYASEADLVSFRQKYLPGKPNANMTIILVNGGQNLQIDPGTEANLDVQYVYGVSLAPITFYSVGGRPPFSPDDASPINTNEPYLDWLDFIGNLNNDEVPKVISNSYGDDEQTVPEDYAKTVCAMFSRLGVRGVSVIFASGDVGVGNGDCVTNDGSNKVVFQPSFPARLLFSCPESEFRSRNDKTSHFKSEKEHTKDVTDQTLIAVYAQSLDIMVSEALEAEQEADWWEDTGRSRWNVLWYLVETLPGRIQSVLQTLRTNLTVENEANSELSLLSLFPHLRDRPFQLQPRSRSILHSSTLEFSFRQLLSFQSIRILYATIRRACLIPVHYALEEISLKRHKLLRIRDERAQVLGELVLLRPELQKFMMESSGHVVVPGHSADGTASILAHRIVRLVNPNLEYDPTTASPLMHLSSSSSSSSQRNIHTLGLSRPSRLTRIWPRLVFGPPIILYSAYLLYSSRGTLREFAKEGKDILKGFVLDWCIKPLAGVLDTVKASRNEEAAGWLVTKEGVKADYDSLERMALSLASDHLHYTPVQLDELSTRIRLGDLTPVLKLYEEDIKRPVKSALGGTLLRTVFIQVQKAKVDLDQALSGIDRLMKSQELTFAFVGLSPALAIVYVLGGWLRRAMWPSNKDTGKYGGSKERKRIFWVMRRVERVLVLDRTAGGKQTESEPQQKQEVASQPNAHPSALTTGLLILSLTQLRTYAERYLPSAGGTSSTHASIPNHTSSESGSDASFAFASVSGIALSPSVSTSTSSYSASSLREAFLEDVGDLQDPELGIEQKRAVVERMWRCWGGALGWGVY